VSTEPNIRISTVAGVRWQQKWTPSTFGRTLPRLDAIGKQRRPVITCNRSRFPGDHVWSRYVDSPMLDVLTRYRKFVKVCLRAHQVTQKSRREITSNGVDTRAAPEYSERKVTISPLAKLPESEAGLSPTAFWGSRNPVTPCNLPVDLTTRWTEQG